MSMNLYGTQETITVDLFHLVENLKGVFGLSVSMVCVHLYITQDDLFHAFANLKDVFVSVDGVPSSIYYP